MGLDVSSAVRSIPALTGPAPKALRRSPPRDRGYAGAGTYFRRFLFLTAIYFAAGKLGLALAFLNESASSVWPPAGIAVGALVAFGWRMWPAVAVGAFFVNWTTSGLVLPSLMIAAGNTLEALAGATLVRVWAGGEGAFERTGGVFRFSTIAFAVAPVIAATLGTATLLAAGLARWPDAASVWLTWWLGDAVGIVMFTPLVVFWMRAGAAPHRRYLETGLVMLAVVLTSWLIFGNSAAGVRHYPLQFLVAPVLLWPAFRLGPRETVTANALLGILAVAGTLNGWGPFVRSSPHESLLLLQSFVGSFAVLMLAVAAEVSTRVRAQAEVRALNETLEYRVAHRTEELLRMHARLAEAQSVAHVGSWEWDVPADSVWWSDELYRIYGVPVGTPITYDAFVRLVHPEDRDLVQRAVQSAMVTHEPFSFEHRIVTPDGVERVLHGQGRVRLDAQGSVVCMVGTGHDVTERKRAEDERAELAREQAARREAEAASRAKDEFLATLSHELRTPLNAALGWAQLVRERQQEPARTERALDAIWRNLRVQARLVDDMLDTSHILMGTLRLDRAAVDLTALTREALEMMYEIAASRRIRIDVSLPETGACVMGDADRLQQVVWNLLSNAVKFSREGGRIRISARTDANSILLAVADDGPGIPAEFLPHVFDRFRQADASVTRQHGGLGLGLAIARHLVEAHGGSITAANQPEGGAVFTLRLPAAATPAA